MTFAKGYLPEAKLAIFASVSFNRSIMAGSTLSTSACSKSRWLASIISAVFDSSKSATASIISDLCGPVKPSSWRPPCLATQVNTFYLDSNLCLSAYLKCIILFIFLTNFSYGFRRPGTHGLCGKKSSQPSSLHDSCQSSFPGSITNNHWDSLIKGPSSCWNLEIRVLNIEWTKTLSRRYSPH